eukprot:982771-Prorocentrum_minimum.AAC.1
MLLNKDGIAFARSSISFGAATRTCSQEGVTRGSGGGKEGVTKGVRRGMLLNKDRIAFARSSISL